MSKRASITEQLASIITDMEDLKAEPAMILAMIKKRLTGRGPTPDVPPNKPVVRRKRRTKAELAAAGLTKAADSIRSGTPHTSGGKSTSFDPAKLGPTQ